MTLWLAAAVLAAINLLVLWFSYRPKRRNVKRARDAQTSGLMDKED